MVRRPQGPRVRLALALALAAAGLARGEGPQAVVQVPPLLVEETHAGAGWTYASVPGYEFLSQCPSDQTEAFAEGVFRAHEVLKLMIPESLQVRLSVPTAFILYPQSKEKSLSGALVEQMNRVVQGQESGSRHVGVIPGLRLDDDDSTEIFTLLGSSGFDDASLRGLNFPSRQAPGLGTPQGDSGLTIQAGYAQFLMASRRPKPPLWLLAGMVGLFNGSDTGLDDIVINEATWVSPEETRRLADDPDAPRTLIPLAELFAPGIPAKTAQASSVLRRSVWLSEATLFIRWSFEDNDEKRIAAFRRFAVAACEGPVDERLFEACFGMGYSRMRDELSDYLPLAVSRRVRITGNVKAAPPVTVRAATRAEVARIKGDWERRAARHMSSAYPTFSRTYLDQAKATFARAIEAGVDDPGVWGAAGLLFLSRQETGDAEAALARAVAGGVVRPVAYLALARLRYARALAESAPAKPTLSLEEARSIESLVRRGLEQDPPLAGLYVLLSDLRSRVDDPHDDGSLALLDRGSRLYPELSALVYRTAVREWKAGDRGEAAALIARGEAAASNQEAREAFRRLAEALRTGAARP